MPKPMHTLTCAEYVKACLRTESPYPPDLPVLDQLVYRVQHGAIGIVTEIGELFEALTTAQIDGVNVSEELGDIFWYAGLLCDVLSVDLESSLIATVKGPEAAFRCVQGAGLILDQCKRKVYYRVRTIKSSGDGFYQTLTQDQRNLVDAGQSVTVPYELDLSICRNGLALILSGLAGLVADQGLDTRAVLTQNIMKLARRYGNKFNSFSAITRNLELERETLKASM